MSYGCSCLAGKGCKCDKIVKASGARASVRQRGRRSRRVHRTFRLLAGQREASEPAPPGRRRTGTPSRSTASRATVALIASRRRRTAPGRKRREALGELATGASCVVTRDARTPRAGGRAVIRPANLATLVDTLKRHLGDGGRGPVDEELTTLYRAASASAVGAARLRRDGGRRPPADPARRCPGRAQLRGPRAAR